MKNQPMLYRPKQKSTAKFIHLPVRLCWRRFQQIQSNQSPGGSLPCHPCLPFLQSQLHSVWQGKLAFSSPPFRLLHRYSPSSCVFVCTQLQKGKGKSSGTKSCSLPVLDLELIKSPLPPHTCLSLLYMRHEVHRQRNYRRYQGFQVICNSS